MLLEVVVYSYWISFCGEQRLYFGLQDALVEDGIPEELTEITCENFISNVTKGPVLIVSSDRQ